jgi:hypothetical protein
MPVLVLHCVSSARVSARIRSILPVYRTKALNIDLGLFNLSFPDARDGF